MLSFVSTEARLSALYGVIHKGRPQRGGRREVATNADKGKGVFCPMRTSAISSSEPTDSVVRNFFDWLQSAFADDD